MMHIHTASIGKIKNPILLFIKMKLLTENSKKKKFILLLGSSACVVIIIYSFLIRGIIIEKWWMWNLTSNNIHVRINAINNLGEMRSLKAYGPIFKIRLRLADPKNGNELLELATVMGSLHKIENSFESDSATLMLIEKIKAEESENYYR